MVVYIIVTIVFVVSAGGVIMYGALILFEDEFIHIVAISFSALIMTELIMVALTIRTWHRLMVLAEVFSLLLYLVSLVVFHEYFGKSRDRHRYALCIAFNRFPPAARTDWEFISSVEFLWKVSAITLVSCLPLYIIKFLRKKFSPPSYSKLS